MIVIDASVAVKWVVPEADSGTARALHSEELVAPALWLIEASNALWRLTNGGKLSSSDAQSRFMQLTQAPVTTVPSESYLPEALDLATKLGHPIYDCIYLAVAIRERTQMVTADKRFLAVIARDRTLKKYVRSLA